MSMKATVANKILKDMLEPIKKEKEWKVLVLDSSTKRILSSAVRTRDVLLEGISHIEDLTKSRQPVPLDAIYFILPTEKSIKMMTDDFPSDKPIKYKAAHVFFATPCPDKMLAYLGSSKMSKVIKTCKEVNVGFLACESQMFSLDSPNSTSILCGTASSAAEKAAEIERLAELLATTCVTMGEYPSIRYRADSSHCFDMAQSAMLKLNNFKADNSALGTQPNKDRSVLLILDRGFDAASPLLHELTLQAMAQDLLELNDNVYKFESQTGGVTEVILDESDEMWVEYRHKHIAVVSTEVPKRLKEFGSNKKMNFPEKVNVRDLKQMMQRMPQYQAEIKRYSVHVTLADECMRKYNANKVEELCKIEQDIVAGGSSSKEIPRMLIPRLLHKDHSKLDKMRLILLYAMSNNGITEENFTKLCEHAELGNASRLKNLMRLNVPVIQDSSRKAGNYFPERKPRSAAYELSRYTPLVKDIMEDMIADKADAKQFPYLCQYRTGSSVAGATAPSMRFGKNRDKTASERSLPRLIVFIIGGMAYSEIRCAYEVTEESKDWEVIIGSTEILTPARFISRMDEVNW